MSNTFTYIIRSSSKITTTDNTNSCTIKLSCPSNYEQFDVEVESFNVATNEFALLDDFCEIRVEGLNIVNGNDTQNHRLTTLGLYSFKSGTSNGKITFRVDNFNNKIVQFKVYGDDNLLLQNAIDDVVPPEIDDFNENWILVLKLTGVN